MPSPLGHAMAGVATAWATELATSRRFPCRALIVACGVMAVVPDLDFLAGSHRTYTHSVGAAVLAALATWMFSRSDRGRRLFSPLAPSAVALLCGTAYLTHVPLDWVASSADKPPGVMAFWPITTAFFEGYGLFAVPEWDLLPLDQFVVTNLTYVALEQVVFLPLMLVLYTARRRLTTYPGRPVSAQPTRLAQPAVLAQPTVPAQSTVVDGSARPSSDAYTTSTGCSTGRDAPASRSPAAS